ncbi:MAG: hypothetical protein EZS28_016353, partial [Streblomastix strix]
SSPVKGIQVSKLTRQVEKKRKYQKNSSLRKKQEGNKAVAAVGVTVITSKYMKIGQEKQIRQLREAMEMRTDCKMMNVIDRQRKRD